MSERRLPDGSDLPPTGQRRAALDRTQRTGTGRPRPANTQQALLEPRTAPRRPTRKDKSGKDQAPRDATPRKAQPVLRFLNGLLTMLVVLGLATVGTGYYLNGAVDAKGPLAEVRVVNIPRNDGRQQIAERLEREGVVDDRRTFVAGLYLMQMMSLFTGGKPINIKAGDYEIKQGASIRSVIETLSEGRSVLVKITVPEGLTSFQIVERLKADQNLTGDLKQVPADGVLMPETYSVPRGTTRTQFVELMQAAQKRVLEQVWAERQTGLPLKTPDEALVLASIIEKETGRNDERDRVAAVFVNRLRQKMPLQSDPTILYGLMQGKVQWGKPILKSEIRSATPFNTYVIPALPPSPICNPGRAALEAAVKPAQTNELFFVADGKGGHVFAATNREHEANVARWRQFERDALAKAGGAQAAQPAPAPAAAPGPVAAPATKSSGAPVQPTTINAGSSTQPAGKSGAVKQ